MEGGGARSSRKIIKEGKQEPERERETDRQTDRQTAERQIK